MQTVHRNLGAIAVLLVVAALCPARAQFADGVAAAAAGNYAKALEAWQTAAAAGDAQAEYGLGYLYQFGLSVPADYGQALSWYGKAAAANNPDALYALGLMYESGTAGRRDLALAMENYRKAAAAGVQADAEFAIGRMILRGRGVPRNPAEAIKWFKTAAGHRQPAAAYMLGEAYEQGWGVPADDGESYYWYRRAQEGDPVELEEQDMAMQPKIAVATVKHRLSDDEIALEEDRLKADLAMAMRAPPAVHPAAPGPSPAKPAQDAQDALTKPATSP
jgi:TPR repeat protein